MEEFEMLKKIAEKIRDIDQILKTNGSIVVRCFTNNTFFNYVPKNEDIKEFILSERQMLVMQYNVLIKNLKEVK